MYDFKSDTAHFLENINTFIHVHIQLHPQREI